MDNKEALAARLYWPAVSRKAPRSGRFLITRRTNASPVETLSTTSHMTL